MEYSITGLSNSAATERYGVQALGDYLARRFALEHIFIDCPNPI